jgi:hypothetical protein
MSSKLIESTSKPSGVENVDEYEEDLEDLEPESSGGEPGASLTMVDMLRICACVWRVEECESRYEPCVIRAGNPLRIM